MQLARGTIVDRPWAVTLAAIDARRLTCRLTVGAGRSQFGMLFDDGELVDASSPMMSDSVAAIASSGGFVRPAHYAEVTLRIAESPGEDPVDVLAHVVGLAPGQTEQLRRTVIELRAARTFSIEYGGFVVEAVELAAPPRTRVDVRRVIYLGSRLHTPLERLDSDLRAFGTHFELRPGATATLSCFGFGLSEAPILDALARGTTIAALDAAGIDQSMSRAAIYSLVMCQMIAIAPEPARAAEPRTVSFRPQQVGWSRLQTGTPTNTPT